MKKHYISIAIVLIAFVFTNLHAQTFVEKQKIVASDRAADDLFGTSVSISGDYSIVGANWEDEDTIGGNTLLDAGSAYVYEADMNGDWNEVQKLIASDRASGDQYGASVAVSGDYAIVGAFQEDEDEYGGGNMTNSGSAYIYERNGSGIWVEVQKIAAYDRSNFDYFGWSVAISGNYAVIGAYNEDQDTSGAFTLTNPGSAYIYRRNGGGGWTFIKKLVASDRESNDLFGYAVAVSGDYVVIGARQEDEDALGGAPWDNSGSAYIFENGGNDSWNEVQKIVASDRGGLEFFGSDVAVDGENLVVGAPNDFKDLAGGNILLEAGAAYVFERDAMSGIWSETSKLIASDRTESDWFGNAVSISNGYVAVGAYKEDEDADGANTALDAGSVYVFELDSNGNWVETDKMVASDRASADWFGNDVSLSGTNLMVSAMFESDDVDGNNNMLGSGSVYAFAFCQNSSSSSTATACNSYLWLGNTYASTGIYTDILPNAVGCDSVLTLNLTINMVSTGVSTSGATLTSLDSGGTYVWIDCATNMPIVAEVAQSFTATADGMYAVEVTNSGCIDTSTCYPVSLTGIVEGSFLNELSVYPNPTKGKVVIELGQVYEDVAVRVTNVTGQVVLNASYANANKLAFEVPGPAGLYFVSLMTVEGEGAVLKVVKG